MELTGLKQIENGYIPTNKPTIEEKVASGIGIEGTTGLSTLADRKYIKNLPKFGDGKPDINPNGISSGHYNFAGRTSAASQLASGPTKIPNNLPTSGGGGASFGKTLGNVASAAVPYAGALLLNATAAVDFVGSIGSAGKFNKSADDLLQEAGGAEGNIGGVSYQTQNEINAQGVSAQTSAENKANTVGLMGKGAALGASLGMVAGPVGSLVGGAVGAIGGLVGGLFGSSKRKREMRRRVAEAQDKALRQNDFSRNGALTSVLQLNYAREYGDTESQSLYGFKDGMLPGFVKGFVPNCKLSNGEHVILHDPIGNPIADIPVGHGRDNKDTLKAFIPNNASVITNKNGATEYLERTGDINGAEYLTAMNILNKKYKNGKLPGFNNGTSIEGNPYYKDRKALEEYVDYMQNDSSSLFRNYKNGKLPGFAWGLPEWSNLLGNAAGYFTAKADKAKIDAEPISRPNTYLSNTNAPQALYILGQLQENPYAIMPDLYNTYAKGMYALSNNGGLSGGQRALARLSAMNNLTANAAKLQQAAQSANIAHRQQYADAMLRYGAADAQNRMAALQHDYNAYSQAHGAKTLMSSQRQTDAMNYLLNGILGNNNLYMWRDMKGLYQQDIDSRRNDRKAKYGLNAPAVVNDKDAFGYITGMNNLSLADEENLFRESALKALQKPMTSAQRIAAEQKRYENNIANLDLSMPTFTFPSLISKKSRKKSIKRK